MFIVKYTGPFAFIKPWTAVRDGETFSQNFLTPSIVEGIEKKLFPELLESTEYQPRLIRHRLTYAGFSKQQEQTQPRGINVTIKKNSITITRSRSILLRAVLVNPILFLGFTKEEFAMKAVTQHICLCRNEDVLLPAPFADAKFILEVSEADFDKHDNGFNGFELIFRKDENSIPVGYNRFRNSEQMYGNIHIVGSNPIYTAEENFDSVE